MTPEWSTSGSALLASPEGRDRRRRRRART
jgi:hypothetical protein